MSENKKNELLIWEGEKMIIISMNHMKYLGWHKDENGEIVDDIDRNQIEIAYREDDEEGFGVGGDVYFTTYDLKAMADCIRDVIDRKETRTEYSCQNDDFRMCISYDEESDTYSFTAALIETLMREYHISITKAGLSRETLEGYIEPFFEWEKEYPIVMDETGL